MKRNYIIDFNLKDLKKEYFDVIIVGTGAAGLFAALHIDSGYKVLLLTKNDITESNSNLAQGGVAVLLNPEDSKETYFQDTVKAGQFYNDEYSTEVLINDSTKNIQTLIQIGTNFDKDENGSLMFTREGGHSLPRILHSKDETGKEIIRSLEAEIKRRNNIELRENVFSIDLLTDKNQCFGILVKQKEEIYAIMAKSVLLATGGIGQIYKDTTNSVIATGDGIAMAHRAGAEIMDMEFIQFHPTALFSKKDERKFLISESLRGDGAVLRDVNGKEFMHNYHELGSLAPRDVVSKAIFLEMKKADAEYLYLDITHRDADYLKKRFPNIYSHCLKEGIDITKDWIPICPVQHYLMGGIKTDIKGRTSINGLYACGECACTGIHGANRLASNSLLEGLVFGRKMAEDFNKSFLETKNLDLENIEHYLAPEKIKIERISEIKKKIKDLSTKYLFILRNYDGLEIAEKEIGKILRELCSGWGNSQDYFEANNMALVSYLVVIAAKNRKESLGSHNIV